MSFNFLNNCLGKHCDDQKGTNSQETPLSYFHTDPHRWTKNSTGIKVSVFDFLNPKSWCVLGGGREIWMWIAHFLRFSWEQYVWPLDWQLHTVIWSILLNLWVVLQLNTWNQYTNFFQYNRLFIILLLQSLSPSLFLSLSFVSPKFIKS